MSDQTSTAPPQATSDPALAVLYEEIADCPNCVLAKTRTQTVPGSGPAPADVMCIGEAPGAREDERGLPFVGPAGRFLDELLGGIGLSRETVHIANVVKCRPPGNHDPEPEEIAACKPFLDRQIAIVDPLALLDGALVPRRGDQPRPRAGEADRGPDGRADVPPRGGAAPRRPAVRDRGRFRADPAAARGGALGASPRAHSRTLNCDRARVGDGVSPPPRGAANAAVSAVSAQRRLERAL